MSAIPPLRIVREDGEAWSVDAVVRFAREPRNTITKYPVEGGIGADHAQREPDRITVAATVTSSPLEGRTWDQPTGRARLDEALRFFAGCTGQALTLEFTDQAFDGFMLAAWPHERTAFAAIKFALQFDEVVVAEAVTVEIPVTQPVASAQAALPTEVDLGEQAPKDPPGSESAAAQDESWLYALMYGSEEEA